MPEEKDPKDMTNEELEAAVADKFGEEPDWHCIDMEDPVAIEVLNRASRGRSLRQLKMSEEKAPKDMTDEEIHAALDERYGADRHIRDLDMNDPIVVEFLNRIARGKD